MGQHIGYGVIEDMLKTLSRTLFVIVIRLVKLHKIDRTYLLSIKLGNELFIGAAMLPVVYTLKLLNMLVNYGVKLARTTFPALVVPDVLIGKVQKLGATVKIIYDKLSYLLTVCEAAHLSVKVVAERPDYKLYNIREVVIEGVLAYAAVLYNIADGDLCLSRLYQIPKGFRYGALGVVRIDFVSQE